MKDSTPYWGQSRWWWLVLVLGILMVVAGFGYWFFPVVGYAVASLLFGWMLIAVGTLQLCISAGQERPRGWGWWLAGGILDIFIGFVLVRNLALAEGVFPFFIALAFIYWGISALVSAVMNRRRKYWWLELINGVLLLILGFFFLDAGYVANMVNVSFLTALAFIYWGFSLCGTAYDMKP